MQPRPEINPLLLELIAANRKARAEDLAAALDVCGICQLGAPVFGVEFISADAHHYAPEPGGKPAVIVPHFEDGRLLDLVAVSVTTRACRTRAGVCTVLGEEWLEHARENDTAARIYPDPLAWLRAGRRGAAIVDWRAARLALADLPALVCGDKVLADRIDKAMRQPVHVPRLVVVGGGPAPAPGPIDQGMVKVDAQAEWAAKTAAHKIRTATAETHPYLDSIGFPKVRGLVHEGMLLVPMRLGGRTVSLQEIAADGRARFLPGGRKAGAVFTIGSGRAEVLCAGYAAALSIRAALDAMCLPARVTCCFTEENAATVAKLRRHAVIFPGDANALHRGDGLPALQQRLLDLLTLGVRAA